MRAQLKRDAAMVLTTSRPTPSPPPHTAQQATGVRGPGAAAEEGALLGLKQMGSARLPIHYCLPSPPCSHASSSRPHVHHATHPATPFSHTNLAMLQSKQRS